MEEIQLKDICDLDNGYAFKSDDYVDKSNTLNCRMSNIRPDGSFDILYSAKYLPDEFAERYKDYILKDGDLIIAMTDMAGDPKILGVPTVVDTKGYKLLLNQRVGRLRFIKDGVNADYLKLALQSKRVREYLKRFAGGGVQLNVSKKDILNAPVRMRNEEEQNHIVALFKQVLLVKKQREQELLLLEELIKARFVEMFENEKTKSVEEVCDSFKIGPFGSALHKHEISNEGFSFVLGTDNAVKNEFDFKEIRYVDETKYHELEKYKVEPKDIIMSMMGTVGRVAVIPESLGTAIISSHLCILKVNKEVMYPEFFHLAFCKDDGIQHQIDGIHNGSIMKGFNLKIVKAFEIKCPSLDKQKEFLVFAKQLDKSKVAVQKALDEVQLLFDSLMQKYFG